MLGMTQSLNLSVACAVSLTLVTESLPHLARLPTDAQTCALADWLMRDVDGARTVLERAHVDISDI